MLFLYSDDGSHFKHNKIPHKMTYGLVSVQGQAPYTGKNNKERQTWDCYRVGGWVATVATVWVATAAYRGGHLIQVTNTAFV